LPPLQKKNKKKPASPDVPFRFSLVLAVEYEQQLPRGGTGRSDTSITLPAQLAERIW